MQHFDLCVIGSGSGNSIVDEQFADQRVAIVEGGTFGGTCVNVGCIPTKMLVYPADLTRTPQQAARLGVDLELRGVDWPAVRDRVFGRVDAISASGRAWREQGRNVTLFSERAYFTGPRELAVGSAGTLSADRFVIAAGSRPRVPEIPGLAGIDFHTSDTVMRLDALPRSMVILGGGYIAAEFAHIFSAYGVEVTVVARSERLLRHEDAEVAERFTDLLGRRVRLVIGTDVERVEQSAGGVRLWLGSRAVEAELLLVAAGRVPNGDTLNLGAAGVEVDEDGFIRVDEHQRTSAEGVFALGDVCSHRMLKHVANHEARVVQHNLLHPGSMIASDHRFVPHAIFSEPQVASVGLTEEQARERSIDISVGRRDYAGVTYGWAMGEADDEHFVKVIVDRADGRLVGAHLIGPQSSSLIQPLIQAMSFGQTAAETARGQYWIHPALAEVVENALLDAISG